MSFSSLGPREWRAINAFCKRHNYKLALSSYPFMEFMNKETNEIIIKNLKTDLSEMLHNYDHERKEAAKERARAKRQEKKDA